MQKFDSSQLNIVCSLLPVMGLDSYVCGGNLAQDITILTEGHSSSLQSLKSNGS